MVVRRMGPTLGAGTVIKEESGGNQIIPSAIGWAGYAGILERGPTDELIVASSREAFNEQCGGLIDDSYVPDAAHGFYGEAAGAGGILLARVTDGNEVKSSVTLNTRKTTLTPMGTLRAKNGGRWGGQREKYTNDLTAAGDLLEITIDTGQTMVVDEWAGGYVELDAVASTQYPIISNDAAGIVTVAADQTMKTDWGAGPSLRYYLVRENGTKYLSYEIKDGEENATTEFGLYIYLNGTIVKTYPNLSTDPTNKRYWIDLLANDDSNYYVEGVDLWTGAHVADVRPANAYGEIDSVTTTVLTPVLNEFIPDSVNAGDGTVALGTTTDLMDQHEVITLTFSSATSFDAVSNLYGSLGPAGTVATPFVPNNKYSPPFTLTAGGNAWSTGSVSTLTYKPFVADELIDGILYPDKVNAPREFYRIVDNDHSTITVAAGSDLTTSGTPGDSFMVAAPQQMSGGIDGNASIADSDYIAAWDTSNSLFNKTADKGYGLVKLATPGVTATAVQKAGLAYADAKNHEYRYEIPAATVTETGADEYINDTIGRSDFAVVTFPSYIYIAHPDGDGEGKLKLISATGDIHGREARMAGDYEGYHKAEAGQDATLSRILKLTTGEEILDEEYLNPKGINIIKKKKGNFVLWGDRTLWLNSTWMWKHQREQMSHYENVLIENFDWIIFAINNPTQEKIAHATLLNYFRIEWQKEALQGDSLNEAAIIKIDSELNTPAVRAAGNMKASVKLWLADTIERFEITIGKQGVFESTT